MPSRELDASCEGCPAESERQAASESSRDIEACRDAADPAWIIALLSVYFLAGLPSSFASSRVSSSRPPNLKSLMRDVAWNELRARKDPAHYYENLLKEQTPNGSRTSLQIQTRQGLVSRLIGVNGKPPTQKQCRNNLASLDRIAASPALQQSRLRSQRADMGRRERLFADMPAAFIFQYEGTEKSTGWFRIRYWPNPDFHPHNRVGGVLLGLQGTLWVDPVTKRLARIQGRLNKNVTFGWGILARLDRGGRFVLQQSKIKNGTWQVTTLFVNFQGTILLFKRLNVNMRETFSSYKEMPDSLTVARAVGILKRVPVHCTGP
jgi:hypothetical protein